MLSAFVKAHWIALFLSAGALTVQYALPQANLAPVLLGLIVLAWGLTSAFALRRSGSAIETDTAPDATTSGSDELGREIQEERALVHSLFNDLNQTVQNEVTSIRDELHRIQGFVGDAAGQLSESFQGMSDRARTQQNLIVSVIENIEAEARSSSDRVSGSLKNVSDLANQINDDVGLAVRALQFEDIVSQRLGNPHRHLDALQSFATVLVDHLDELDAMKATTGVGYSAGLQQIRDNLALFMADGEAEEHTLVGQDSMQAGSIDLF